MASFPESDFQLCPLCKEMCNSSAPISSSSSSSSSSQVSNSSSSAGSAGGGSGTGLASAPLRRLHVLPCLHAFCRQCLEGRRTPGDSLQLRCPICDHKVLISEAGMDALPSSTFLHLSNLLDSVVGTADEQQQSNGGRANLNRHRSASCSSSGLLRRAPPCKSEPRCSSCDEGNGASSHCLDCQENLCDNCLRAHQRVRLTKDHFIERFPASPCSSATSSVATTLSSSSSAFSLLPVYPERLYCQQHDEEVSVEQMVSY